MNLIYNGFNTSFLSDAFFDAGGNLDIDLLSASATEIVGQQPSTGDITTIMGTGLSVDSSGNPNGGTVTGATFSTGGDISAVVSNVSWSFTDFFQALLAVSAFNDVTPFANLLLSSPNLTFDGSGANSAFDMEDFGLALAETTSPMTVLGTAFNDNMFSGLGDDSINPGANTGYDRIHASEGNDTYNFADADDNSFYEIEYDEVAGPITVTADVAAGSLSVQGNGWTDSFVNAANAFQAENGGLSIVGSLGNDIFNLTHNGYTGWAPVGGGAGADTYNIAFSGEGGFVRIFFNWYESQGLVVDMSTGVIQNDGAGNAEQINITGNGSVEISGTSFGDSFTGSDGNDYFRARGGNDTIDGGDGFDRVRYDDSRYGSVNIDLAAGTATGTWDGVAFTSSLTSVEYLRGSRSDDTLSGSDENERLEGRDGDDMLLGLGGDDSLDGEAGNDTLIAGAGEDTLEGGAGNDSLVGGDGRDRLRGGDGDDTIDASGGAAETQGYGDIIDAGTGTNTIIGHQAAWALDEGAGLDLMYTNIDGTGGMTVIVGENGSGTGVSNTAGVVSDTFTYVDHIEGSAAADNLMSTGASRVSWVGEAGDDTITGGSGFDLLQYWLEDDGTQGVVVDLAAGTATDSYGDTDTFSNVEGVQGSHFGDTITGSTDGDYITGEGGNDNLSGGAGNDFMEGSEGSDTMDGGDGTDRALYEDVNRADLTITQSGGTITVTHGSDVDILTGFEEFAFADGVIALADLTFDEGSTPGELLVGTDGNDTLVGTQGDDTIAGGEGDDDLSGGDGNDNIAASSGNDTVDGGAGNDSIGGGLDDDILQGGTGNDVIGSGQGNDMADGGTGNDGVFGGAGDDTLLGGDGDDNMGGSFGTDNVDGGAGDDDLGGGAGGDLIAAGDGNDAVGGGEGDDTITGGTGNDFLAGGGRHDQINGNGGDDTINGGNGDDTMTGGNGSDVFIFNGFNAGDADVITDWTNGEDTFRMSGVMGAPGTGLAGKLAALNATDVAGGVQLSYEGHTILLEGASAAQLGLEDFVFV